MLTLSISGLLFGSDMKRAQTNSQSSATDLEVSLVFYDCWVYYLVINDSNKCQACLD